MSKSIYLSKFCLRFRRTSKIFLIVILLQNPHTLFPPARTAPQPVALEPDIFDLPSRSEIVKASAVLYQHVDIAAPLTDLINSHSGNVEKACCICTTTSIAAIIFVNVHSISSVPILQNCFEVIYANLRYYALIVHKFYAILFQFYTK